MNRDTIQLTILIIIALLLFFVVLFMESQEKQELSNKKIEIENLTQQVEDLKEQIQIKDSDNQIRKEKISALLDYHKYTQTLDYETIDASDIYNSLADCLFYKNQLEKKYEQINEEETQSIIMLKRLNNENNGLCSSNIDVYESSVNEIKDERKKIILLSENLCEAWFDDSVSQNTFDRQYSAPLLDLIDKNTESIDQLRKDYSKAYQVCLE